MVDVHNKFPNSAEMLLLPIPKPKYLCASPDPRHLRISAVAIPSDPLATVSVASQQIMHHTKNNGLSTFTSSKNLHWRNYKQPTPNMTVYGQIRLYKQSLGFGIPQDL